MDAVKLSLVFMACFSITIGRACETPEELSDMIRRSPQSGLSTPVLSDNRLLQNWYTGKGYTMVDNTSIPLILSCSTVYPMYLQEQHPTLLDGENTNAIVCVVGFTSNCVEETTIKIRRCQGTYEYYLSSTSSQSAYCFEWSGTGDAAPSDSVLGSASVQCALDYIKSKEHWIPKLNFFCTFSEDDYFYHVNWFVDNKLVQSSQPTNNDVRSSSRLNEDTIIEAGYKLGITVHCSVSASHSENGLRTTMTSSDGFFAGLKLVSPSSPSIIMEKGKKKEIIFRNTVPIGCPSYFTEMCKLELVMYDPNEAYNDCQSTSVSSLSNSRLCGTHFSTMNKTQWDHLGNAIDPCTSTDCVKTAYLNATLTVTTRNDAIYDGKETSHTIRLQTKALFHSIWHKYSVTDLTVTVLNDGRWETKRCSSHVDPHGTTGDGSRYENQKAGTFVFLKQDDLEVQETTTSCNGLAFCTCSVIIRAGGDLFQFSVCGKNRFINFLRCEDDILDVRRIDDKFYQVHTPIGTIVEVKLVHFSGEFFLNLDVILSPKNLDNVYGLCGNFDGDPSNDFRLPDNSTYIGESCDTGYCLFRGEDFAHYWRVSSSTDYRDPRNHAAISNWPVYNTLCVCPKAINEKETSTDILCSPSEFLTCTTPKRFKGDQQSCTISRRRRSLHSHSIELMHRFERESAETKTIFKRSVNLDNASFKQGMKECKEYLEAQQMYQQFDGVLPDSAATETMVGDCGADYVYVESTEDLKESHFEGWKSQNLNEIEKNDTYKAVNNETVTAFHDINCLNNCSSKGECVKGICNCTSGHVGDDCSINLSDPIDVQYIGGGDLCDREHDTCDLFSVQAENMIRPVFCKIERIQLFDDGPTDISSTHAFLGNRINMFETDCYLNLSGNETSSNPFPFVIKHNIFISNDGSTFGTSKPVYMYDSLCQNYTLDTDGTFQFYLLSDTCYIDGLCILANETSPSDPCSVCDPNHSTKTWRKISENACIIDDKCIPIGDDKTSADCLYCDTENSNHSWTIKVGKCFINDECKNDQERSPEEPCSFCSTANKTDDWTIEHTAACVIDGTCIPDDQKNTTFDCLECSSARDEQAWSVTVGKCFINNECKNDQVRSPEEPCSFCSPANKTDDWTIEHTAACVIDGTCIPDGQKNTTFDCLECSSARDEQAWSVTPLFCYIDEQCVSNGTVSSDDTCNICITGESNVAWTYACEASSGSDTFTEAELFVVLASVGSGIVVVVIVIVIVLVVIYCRKGTRHSLKDDPEDSYLGGSMSKNEQPSIQLVGLAYLDGQYAPPEGDTC